MSLGAESAAVATRKLERWLVAGIVVCILMAGVIFFWVNSESQRVPYLNVQVLPSEISGVEVDAEATLARPLFWSARRPVLGEVVDVSVEPKRIDAQALEGVQLLGILANAKTYTALIQVDGKVERVQPGAVVKQWDVAKITERKVYFNNQRQESVLSLEREIHQNIKLGL